MDEGDVRRIVDDAEGYDDSREITLRRLVSEFYGRKMRFVMIWTWACGLAFAALCLVSAALFIRSEASKDLILYATLFISGIVGISFMKAWPLWMYLLRTTKRLDIQLAAVRERLREDQ